MMMLEIAATALLLLQPAAAQKAAPPKPAPAEKPAATDLAVTVNYKGKGTVDAGHKVIVWCSRMLRTLTSATVHSHKVRHKKTARRSFQERPAKRFLSRCTPEGGYDGISGPPPHGLPSSLYRKWPKTPPVAVKAGGPAIKFTFDDSERWNK